MNITDIDDKIIKKAIQVCLILSVKKKISEKHKLTSFWFLFKNEKVKMKIYQLRGASFQEKKIIFTFFIKTFCYKNGYSWIHDFKDTLDVVV